jgi:anaerobic magnesium-protoporphyrin IX monomethyl ester cyclase
MARVLFLQDALYESFGPQLLSGVLRREGHECDLMVLACEGRRAVSRRLREWRPQIVAFSISSFGYEWSLRLADQAKREIGTITVFGGPHPTFAPEFARHPEVDYACRGEGEGAFSELARAVESGDDPAAIDNLISRNGDGDLRVNPLRPLIEDLDSLPFADRTIHFKYPALRELPYKRFLVGRGCPYGCTYCFNKAARTMYAGLGRYVRHRSPEDVVAEILDVRDRYGIGVVGFVDDTFTTKKAWTLRFLELYRRKVALPFTCLIRANELDEELAEALGASGCRYASFGIEAGNEELRNTVLDRHMSNDQIRGAAALLHRSGVKFLTYNMFGVPGETAEDGLATVRLNAEIGTDLCGTSIFQPLVGTESFEYCQREAYLDPTDCAVELDRITVSSPLQNMPDLRFLQRLQKIAFIGVHWPKLIPVVALLARLPLDPLFWLLYKISLLLRFKLRFQLSLCDVLRVGLRSRGRFG